MLIYVLIIVVSMEFLIGLCVCAGDKICVTETQIL